MLNLTSVWSQTLESGEFFLLWHGLWPLNITGRIRQRLSDSVWCQFYKHRFYYNHTIVKKTIHSPFILLGERKQSDSFCFARILTVWRSAPVSSSLARHGCEWWRYPLKGGVAVWNRESRSSGWLHSWRAVNHLSVGRIFGLTESAASPRPNSACVPLGSMGK